MTNKFGSDNIIFEHGVAYEEHKEWTAEDASGIEKAVAQAKDVDYIIACVGENSYAETTGNISDLNLSSNQKLLVKRLQETGKPVILILNEGRPRLIHDLVDGCKAIVNIMLPGNYGGDALADLLSGDENFSGRLPLHILHTLIRSPPTILKYARQEKLCPEHITMRLTQTRSGGLVRE